MGRVHTVRRYRRGSLWCSFAPCSLWLYRAVWSRCGCTLCTKIHSSFETVWCSVHCIKRIWFEEMSCFENCSISAVDCISCHHWRHGTVRHKNAFRDQFTFQPFWHHEPLQTWASFPEYASRAVYASEIIVLCPKWFYISYPPSSGLVASLQWMPSSLNTFWQSPKEYLRTMTLCVYPTVPVKIDGGFRLLLGRPLDCCKLFGFTNGRYSHCLSVSSSPPMIHFPPWLQP